MQPSNDHIEHMEKATQGFMKACEDAGCMAKDHMDASMKTASTVGAAVGKGMEEIMNNVGAMLQESMNRGVEAGKNLSSVKSVPEAINLQQEFMKDWFDQWVATTGKISEISARMAQEVMSPIADHANTTIAKVSQKMKTAA